jgi:hypothetical protein
MMATAAIILKSRFAANVDDAMAGQCGMIRESAEIALIDWRLSASAPARRGARSFCSALAA